MVSIEIGDANSVTEFVGENMDLNLVSIYGNSPFHTMGLIRVISPAPPSVDVKSYLGSLGNIMDDSGLLDVIQHTAQVPTIHSS